MGLRKVEDGSQLDWNRLTTDESEDVPCPARIGGDPSMRSSYRNRGRPLPSAKALFQPIEARSVDRVKQSQRT